MTNTTQPQLEIEKIITDLNNQVTDCKQAISKLREVNALLGVKVDLPILSNLEKYEEIHKLNSNSLNQIQDQMKEENVVMVKGFGTELNLFGATRYCTGDMTLCFKMVDGKVGVTKLHTDDTILVVSAFYGKNGLVFNFAGKKSIEVKKVPTSDGEMLLIQF